MTKKIDYSANALKVFAAYILRFRKLFAIDMICAVLVAAIDLVFPWVSRLSMNSLLPEAMFSAFFAVMAIMLVAFALKSLLYYIITVLGHRMGVLVEAEMRKDVFTHMQSLSCSFYDSRRTGALMTHITTDLFDVTELAHHGPENVLICTLTIVGALAVMFTIDWRLALVLTLLLPLCMFFVFSQRVRMKNCNMEVKKKTGVIYSAIESSISGIRTAKAFANEQQEGMKFDEANDIFKGAKTEYYKAMGLFMSGMEFTTGIMQLAVIAVGGWLIMCGEMDYVDLITFSLYVTSFVTPVRKLTQFSEMYMQGSAGFSRFLEIMRTAPEITDSENALELENVRGEIKYENVSFEYGRGVPVLKNVSITVAPGQTLALVGASGGGKTTMCQLLPRFYEVCEGSIKVDGHDLRNVTQESLRRNIGLIEQNVFMFAGTVKDNIRYGKPEATDEEIIEAAKLAEIHDEIMAMPEGYDSYIGERGVMLSGGQKQRLSIARVFLKNPPILVLDEATSALDTVTERNIQASLDRLSENRSSIIIAHRLSTVRHADIIAVVEDGEIVERGSHQQLMEKGGIYASLCAAQELK